MGKGKPIIPEWLETMVSYAKFLPIEKRKIILRTVMYKLNDQTLGGMVGKDNVQGARFMADFISGEGKPREVNITPKEWETIVNAPASEHSKQGWKPSTNPKFHHKQGWEWKQVVLSPAHTETAKKDPGRYPTQDLPWDLHNVLGYVTTIRRKAVPGGHEYQIAEDFDFRLGAGKEGMAGTRNVDRKAAMLVEAIFPEYAKSSVGSAKDLGPKDKEVLLTAGTPVPIQSTYFKADEKNVKVKPHKSYLTKLSAGDEQEFQVWFDRYVREVHGPLIQMNPDEKEQYYDYRGYWKDNRGEASKPMKRGQHLTDRYKIPGHPSFSIESKYYQPGMEKNTKVIQWKNGKPVRIGSQ